MTAVKKRSKKKPGPKGPSKYTEAFIKGEADALLKWLDNTHFILGKFSVERGYSRQRLHEMAELSDYFSSALKIAKTHQENVLFEGALSGELQQAMAIFGLKNVAEWRDEKKDPKQDMKVVIELVKFTEKDIEK